MFFKKKAGFKSMFTDQSKANRITIGLKSLHAHTRTFSNSHLDLVHILGVKLKDQKGTEMLIQPQPWASLRQWVSWSSTLAAKQGSKVIYWKDHWIRVWRNGSVANCWGGLGEIIFAFCPKFLHLSSTSCAWYAICSLAALKNLQLTPLNSEEFPKPLMVTSILHSCLIASIC